MNNTIRHKSELYPGLMHTEDIWGRIFGHKIKVSIENFNKDYRERFKEYIKNHYHGATIEETTKKEVAIFLRDGKVLVLNGVFTFQRLFRLK